MIYLKRDTREETRRASLDAMLARVGILRQSPWRLIGPFDNADGRGARTLYPPEAEIDLHAEYVGVDRHPVRWRETAFEDGVEVNLDIFPFHHGWQVCYLTRTIETDREVEAALLLGSDDSITAWINGTKVHEFIGQRGMPEQKDAARVRLARGVNRVLLKVGDLTGAYAYYYQLSLLRDDDLAALDARLDADFPPQGEPAFYRRETVPVPQGIVLEVGGLAFSRDGSTRSDEGRSSPAPSGAGGLTTSGSLAICTRRGEIWMLRPAAANGTWTRFAYGLHEALGICPGDAPGGSTPLTASEWVVVQRPELTRLRDTDGDGVADRFETVTDAWGLSGNYHEFAYGPVRDHEGNLCGTLNVAFTRGEMGDAEASWRGWAFKVTPGGEFVPWAPGLRSPNGVGVSPDGELFAADNQGEFVGTSPVFHLARGGFYGHPAGLVWDSRYAGEAGPASLFRLDGDYRKIDVGALDRMRRRPALLLPYGEMGQSTSQLLWDDTDGKFGPFAGQMFIGDERTSVVMRACLEKVGGEWQGACFPFRSGFQCGVNRLAFGPDGSLWVGETDRGWGSVGGKPWGLQRLVWTGRVPMEIREMHATREGFDLVFTKPVDPATASDPAAYSMQHYRYLYHITYGSPQVENAPVAVKQVRISDDRRRVGLVLPDLVPGTVYELRIKGLAAADGSALEHPAAFYTLNRRAD